MKTENAKAMWQFLFTTFGISWALAFFYWLATSEVNTSSVSYFVMALTYMFTPMISAFFVKKVILKQEIKQSLGVNFKWNRWWTIAWFLPLGISVSVMGIGLLFPGVSFSPEMEGMFDKFEKILTPEQMEEMRNTQLPLHPYFLTLLQGLIAAVTFNAVAGFGEELGWRGLLYDSLKKRGFWKMSLIIGIIWGVWHSPIILMGHNYPQYPVIGVFMMIVFCVLISPLFTLIREKSNSVIAASILHGGINAMGGSAVMLLKGGNELLIGFTGLAGFLFLSVLNILIYFYKKRDIQNDY